MSYIILQNPDTLTLLNPYFPNIAKNYCKKTGFQMKKTASKSVVPFESHNARDRHTNAHRHQRETYITFLFVSGMKSRSYCIRIKTKVKTGSIILMISPFLALNYLQI